MSDGEAERIASVRETSNLEFKSQISNSFLKTVSAFANYGGGTVLFGVDDDGKAVGLKDPGKACIVIEDKVNDSISPQPKYSLEINEVDSTIRLHVEPGASKPYLYNAKAYRRNDSATVEADPLEMTRLILQGRTLSFDRLPADSQNLNFTSLEKGLKAKTGIKEFDKDILRTLGLLSADGEYNNAAALLADSNDFPGIDMAVFGDTISIIRRRVTSKGKSVILEYEDALRLYRECYRYEEVSGSTREMRELVPEDAFREAVANALAHRTWDVPAHIRVFMFDDHIEIASPGGLPQGMSEEEYLEDRISVRRNPVLAEVLFRLGIIEALGTGIHRIRSAYTRSITKPQFSVKENTIAVILPVIKTDLELDKDQQAVFDLLSTTKPASIGGLVSQVPFGRTKLTSIMKGLVSMGIVKSENDGRNRKYRRA